MAQVLSLKSLANLADAQGEKKIPPLKTLKCPNCGAPLKAVNDSDAIDCVYCGNTVVPVNDSNPVEGADNAFSGTIRIEGIKTSASALAYMDEFFEEYDWASFATSDYLTVYAMDKLVSSVKMNSADDKNTWICAFKASYVPFVKKVEGCNTLLREIIEEYEKDDLDAYSKFDAYKRVTSKLASSKESTVATLEKAIANAKKYGAEADELEPITAALDSLKSCDVDALCKYDAIDSIPEIKRFADEKNARIAEELRAKGIDANALYNDVKTLIQAKSYVKALQALHTLDGYLDSASIAKKVDNYYLIDDILEVTGKLYYYMSSPKKDTLSLYPEENGTIAKKPLIKKIAQVVTNYADLLYFVDNKGKLKKYDLANKLLEKVYDKHVSQSVICVYKQKAYLMGFKGKIPGESNELIELDLATGATRSLLTNVRSIISIKDGKIAYISSEIRGKAPQPARTCVLDLDSMRFIAIGTLNITLHGYIGDYAIYTRQAPNKLNQNLYAKSISTSDPEFIIEHNIYAVNTIMADKIFFYIGSSANKSLISINPDGTDRKEYPLFVSKLLFEQGGWIYFIRRSGYNAVLCKSRIDGSAFTVIAPDIDEFVSLKNGYLYYISTYKALMKVRMDGTTLTRLCDKVDKVLSVNESKLIYITFDDNGKKSIYAESFDGSGKRKLVYDIRTAKEYDDNTIYYITSDKVESDDGKSQPFTDTLCRLFVDTNVSEELLEVDSAVKKALGCILAILIGAGLIIAAVLIITQML
ncbi:MAG: DUF5050 domain-containing protein [Clostridia bacterium]|nr:DUF5050 domain-containing protein [Clostridia bacterium]